MGVVSGLLFDIDGTLIDSNDAHARAWSQVFQENGFQIAFDDIRKRIGMGGDHLLPELVSIDVESPEGKKLDDRRGEIFRSEHLPRLQAFPKARQLLETLKAKDYRLAVATSASAKDLKLLLRQTDLEGLFDAKTNSSEVENSKPDPDIIIAALESVDLKAANAIMIGDTPYDIEAASRANVRSIGLTCGGWPTDRLKQAGAWKVYQSPDDLLTHVKSGEAFLI